MPLLVVACIHYLTTPDPHWVHDVARRLYYVPIVVAGTIGGLRGGLVVALTTNALYAPHAFLHTARDPGSPTEKLLEMGFYVVLGLAAGALAERNARDVRQQVELTRRLRRSLEEVQAKDAQLARAGRLQAIGELTAGLAHEIRNPLHAIRGSAEIMLDAIPEGAEEYVMGRRLIGEIDRLATVLSRFLDFAKGSEPRVAPTDLAEVVHHVAGLVEAQAGRQETAVSIRTNGATLVAADHDQLVQVVLGICINGLQSLEHGGELSLTLASRSYDGVDYEGIWIENDGPPIPDHLIDRVFDPFVSTREQGSGLGLSTAWRIVAAHGGRIEVGNLPGDRGVAFHVLLPTRS
jgi:signal transduction histidine kinase